MSPTWTTFLYEAANFCVFAAVLGWLFFKPVRKALASHRAALQQRKEQAESALAEANRVKADIDAQRQRLAAELEQLRQKLEAEAHHEAETIIADARKAGESQRQARVRDLERLGESQVAHLAAAVAQAARQVVLRLLQQIDGPELEQALIRAAVMAVEKLRPDQSTTATIESSQELDDAARSQLIQSLGHAASATRFRVNPALIVGLRIMTSRGLIDMSGAGLALVAVEVLAQHMNEAAQDTVLHA